MASMTTARVAKWILLAFLMDFALLNNAAPTEDQQVPTEPPKELNPPLGDTYMADGSTVSQIVNDPFRINTGLLNTAGKNGSRMDKFMEALSKTAYLRDVSKEVIVTLVNKLANLMVLIERRRPSLNPLDEMEEEDRKLLLKMTPDLAKYMGKGPMAIVELVSMMLPPKVTPADFIKTNLGMDASEVDRLNILQQVVLIFMWQSRSLQKGMSDTVRLVRGVLGEKAEDLGRTEHNQEVGDFFRTLHLLRTLSGVQSSSKDAVSIRQISTNESRKETSQKATTTISAVQENRNSSTHSVEAIGTTDSPPAFRKIGEVPETSTTPPTQTTLHGNQAEEEPSKSKSIISIKMEISKIDRSSNHACQLFTKTAQIELDEEALKNQQKHNFSDVLREFAGSGRTLVLKQSEPQSPVMDSQMPNMDDISRAGRENPQPPKKEASSVPKEKPSESLKPEGTPAPDVAQNDAEIAQSEGEQVTSVTAQGADIAATRKPESPQLSTEMPRDRPASTTGTPVSANEGPNREISDWLEIFKMLGVPINDVTVGPVKADAGVPVADTIVSKVKYFLRMFS